MKKILLTLAALMGMNTFASQPLRRYVTLKTGDGRCVTVTRYGSDAFSWWAGDDGERFMYDATRQCLQTMSEETFRTKLEAAKAERPNHGPRRAMNASTEDGLGAYGQSAMGAVKSIGNPTIPVIMVAFADKDFLPANTEDKIDRFLNEEGYHDEPYAVGSVGDYFRHCSYGAFTPHFEVVAKVTLSHGYKYYGANENGSSDARRAETVREAVALAEARGVDFSKYATDGRTPLISILHAGPGEQEDFGNDYKDYLWAHYTGLVISAKTTTFDSYLLTNEAMRDFDKDHNVTAEYMTGIGTFCHEFSHALGLPDTYDVNGATSGEGQTPGYWDVMDYQFMYNGFRPMEYNAYERSMMGWLEVEDLAAENAEKTYEIKPLATTPDEAGKFYRIVNPHNPNEYVLLENRQKSPFYASELLGSGMLAWHVNYTSSRWAGNTVNTSASDLRLHVIPADGAWQKNQDLNKRDANNKRYSFTGDLFPGYAEVTTLDSHLDSHLTPWFDGSVRTIETNSDGIVTFRYGSIQTSTTDGMHPDYEGHDAKCFDLQGRTISRAAAKEVYIKHNKIIINK